MFLGSAGPTLRHPGRTSVSDGCCGKSHVESCSRGIIPRSQWNTYPIFILSTNSTLWSHVTAFDKRIRGMGKSCLLYEPRSTICSFPITHTSTSNLLINDSELIFQKNTERTTHEMDFRGCPIQEPRFEPATHTRQIDTDSHWIRCSVTYFMMLIITLCVSPSVGPSVN